MTQMQLRVPKAIEKLVGNQQNRLLRPALRMAAKQRTRELEKECREALTNIRRYERKYDATLSQFERKKMRTLGTVQAHEDYNDWFFWTCVRERAQQAIAAMKKMETVV